MVRQQPKFTRWLIAIFLACVSTAMALEPETKQNTASTPLETSALGVRQLRVKRMMQALDRKFQDLAQKLRETEPDQAEILIKAFQQSQERLIETRMSEISDLLDAKKLGEADTKQDEVLIELDDLLRVLMDQTKDWDKIDQEIERLELLRKAVQDLLKQQREHLRQTDRLANRDRTLEDMDQQIQEIEDLIQQQTKLEEETANAVEQQDEGKQTEGEKPNADEQLADLAKQQETLSERTQELAKNMGASDEEDSSETPTTAKKASETKDAQPNDDPAQGDPSKTEPGESNQAGESGQPKDGSGQCKACLGQAAQSQKSAAHKLAKQLPKDARADERSAIDKLQEGLNALKQDRDRIARLPKEMLDQMAQQQDATSDDANELLEEMKQPRDAKTEKSADKGKENVQQARQSMKGAADGLRESDLEAAADDQQNAVEELKKALNEIEQRLAQLREDTLIDRLARLEARFRDMLARQKTVTEQTAAIHDRKAASGKLARADRLKLRKLAAEEQALSEEAYQSLDILVEDGTSVVFPRVVTSLQADLSFVGEMLSAQRTDQIVQNTQNEVEVTLQELIDALQRNLKKKKGGGGGGNCDCEPPLLPGSAELKLLRSMQLRVNRRTAAYDELQQEGKVDEVMQKEVSTLSKLQEEVAEMTLELAEKY